MIWQMQRKLIEAVGCAMLAASCVACGAMPQTAAEFRTAVQEGAFMMDVISFETDRPWQAVAEVFEARAPQCLGVDVATESISNKSYQYIVAAYKPTVIIDNDRVELHVQRHYERGVIGVHEEPEGGHYVLVADARAHADKTRVDIYAPTAGEDPLVEAVKNWATGESTACPHWGE